LNAAKGEKMKTLQVTNKHPKVPKLRNKKNKQEKTRTNEEIKREPFLALSQRLDEKQAKNPCSEPTLSMDEIVALVKEVRAEMYETKQVSSTNH
jgi:hypothetical protein